MAAAAGGDRPAASDRARRRPGRRVGQRVEAVRRNSQPNGAAGGGTRRGARRQRSFAIIPYQGPAARAARPIYIECRETAHHAATRRRRLASPGFLRSVGPGNPLDAALRSTGNTGRAAEGQPPLASPIRCWSCGPDGAVAYSMARAAMSNWDDEFGYELIDAEMALDFPPRDPG